MIHYRSTLPTSKLVAGLAVTVLTLGASGQAAHAQLDPGQGDSFCGAGLVERGTPATPELVADIDGLAEQLSLTYGESIEKTQQLFEDDVTLATSTCTSLLGNAHVVSDLKGGYLLIDEQETALGEWRPGMLSFEVTRDGFALACHFADVGSAGDKVLYALHSWGLFLGDQELTYLADIEVSGIYVAIDRDGNLVGGPPGLPPGEDDDVPTTISRDECMTRGGSGGAGPRFAACFASGKLRGECAQCCGDLADACEPHSDFGSMFGIRANIRDCYKGCKELPTAAQITISTP